MIADGDQSRSPSSQWYKGAASHSMLFVVMAVGAGIWLTTLLLTPIGGSALVSGPPPVPIKSGLGNLALWKDDPDVSFDTVLNRICYWSYGQQYLGIVQELVPVDDRNELYLTFEPDRGGFNNVRMQLEILVQIARATRRTLVLPPDFVFNHLEGESNVGDYFQLEHTANYIRIISIDDYLEIIGVSLRSSTHTAEQIFDLLRSQPGSFSPQWSPDRSALVFPPGDAAERIPTAAEFLNGRRAIHYEPDELGSYQTLHFRSDYENGYRLLAVPCTFVYYPTLNWERYARALLRYGFHYRQEIFAVAAKVIHEILSKSGRFNAIHVRRNDFRLQYADKIIGWKQLTDNLQKLLDPDIPVYIASDENTQQDSDFQEFTKHFKTVYFLRDFKLPEESNKNWFGMIEQIVCSSAERFIGTELSTYTAYIHRLRGYMASDVAPDKNIYYTTDQFTGYTMVDGWRTYRTWMKMTPNDVADDPGGYWQREYWISWQM